MLFDKDFYYSCYADVREAGVDAFFHFKYFGWREGRNPSKYFATTEYLERYDDVRSANINPLFHYVKWGYREGRVAIPVGANSVVPSPQQHFDSHSPFDKSKVFMGGQPAHFEYLPSAPNGMPDYFTARALGPSAKNLILAVINDNAGWQDLDKKLSIGIFAESDVFIIIRDQTLIGRLAANCSRVRNFFIVQYSTTHSEIHAFLHFLNASVVDDYEAACLLVPGADIPTSTGFMKFCNTATTDEDIGILADKFEAAATFVTDDIRQFLNRVLPRLSSVVSALDFSVPRGCYLYLNVMILRHVAALKLHERDLIGASNVSQSSWLAKFQTLAGYFANDGAYTVKSSVASKPSNRKSELKKIKSIAFLLPQFHPVEENDKWWGKGFTEWNNVIRGRPQFLHHYQPRLPKDLGFYDLRHPDTQQRQADLAQDHGVYGFCYYYYWFNGKKVLNEPIEQMLQLGKPDHPFCVCWANENWSRNWDGQERFVLLRQNYSLESSRALIREFITMMRDPRYIRHNGKPVLLVYRIRIIPNWKETAEMWRQECRKAGIGEIHLCAARFALEPLEGAPEEFSVDSYVLFPPHETQRNNQRHEVKNLNSHFNGEIFSYDGVVTGDLERFKQGYPWKVHRGAMMGWDNTARRQHDSRIFHGATPLKLRRWLKGIISQELQYRKGSESLLFINAWNEWAEGTTLEPDQRFGDGYLRAVRSTIGKYAPKHERTPSNASVSIDKPSAHAPAKRISAQIDTKFEFPVRYKGDINLTPNRPTILICAHISGHQLFGGERSFLDLVEALNFLNYNVIACLPSSNNRQYVEAIRKRVHCLYVFRYPQWHSRRDIDQQLVLHFSDIIAEHNVSLVYANTIVLLEPLYAAKRMRRLRLIHAREIISLDAPLQERLAMTAEEAISEVFERSDFLIANSNATYNLFARHHRTFYVPNAVNLVDYPTENVVDGKFRFGLVSSNIPKKGILDFLKIAAICETMTNNAEFLIIGPENEYTQRLRNSGQVPKNVKFVGYKESPMEAMNEINVLLNLSNFAESFGRTVAEAMASHRPVIGYEWGAIPEQIQDGVNGFLVPYRDIDAAADAVLKFCRNPSLISAMGNKGRDIVSRKFSYEMLRERLASALDNVFDAERAAQIGIGPKYIPAAGSSQLTIIIPVYNAYDQVRGCIESVLKNSDMSRVKLLVINDGSTDERIRDMVDSYNVVPNVEVMHNEINIGYTRTINRGIRWAVNDDVILLNSDAIVTPNWIAGLRAVAFQQDNIATVTAMSDNAGAFSFPNINEKNLVPSGITRDEFAAKIVQGASHCAPVSVPTGSGFCMYIRREAITQIGFFDEEAFARGYGEENDFCMRANAMGWKNLISPWAYVYHVRTASFGSEKETLVKAGVNVVTKRYPHYAASVKEAFNSDAILTLREATLKAYN
ncbi:glycoside hydrolase family 99-like domain-containing protein [Phyllobacterium phragmitis]|nr:glycoside hydrolase family 99-like domain-containing protein [Phyllobacterium phragmitis]